jgi:predicted amidophosphoribosyltransferase
LTAAMCPSCQKKVYLEDEATPACPVCSSPLLAWEETEEPIASDAGT